MTAINRTEISEVLAQPVEGDTISERNENRRLAVVQFLSTKPNIDGLQGSSHDMILSDLESYPEWEREDAGSPARRSRSGL